MTRYQVELSTRVTVVAVVEASNEESARIEALKAAPYYENSRAHYDEWEVVEEPQVRP